MIDCVGRGDFPRLRFGVGRPEVGQATKEFVLDAFSCEEERALEALVARAVEAVRCALVEGFGAAMSVYNAPLTTDPSAADD